MDEKQKASILAMAKGAISERVDYEMGKIIQNILDPNTEPKKTRKLTLELAFVPSADRNVIQVLAQAKTKLEPTTHVQTALAMYAPMDGEPQFIEMTAQAPGQLDLYGNEEEQPKVLIFTPEHRAV
jgi:hypothetical protein